MADQPPTPFAVVIPGNVRSEIKRLGRKAAALGVLASYVQDLRAMRERLSHDPATWGEYKFRLQFLGAGVYHRIQGMISIHYAVDEPHQFVWVSRVVPLPTHPLGQGE
jgi:hypothetical protein